MSRYLWVLRQRTVALVNKCNQLKLLEYQALLRFEQYVLRHLYVNALTFEEHLLITDGTNVKQPSSNVPLRKLLEANSCFMI